MESPTISGSSAGTPQTGSDGPPAKTGRNYGALLAVSAFVTLAAWTFSLVNSYEYDGISWTPWIPMHTSYGASYYEAGFRAIKLGMPEEKVLTIIGEPLSKADVAGEGVYWYYSRPAAAGSYLIRIVVFRNGAVHRVIHRREYD